MKITVNQKLLVFDDKISLEGLLENLAVTKKYMAVEINGIIIPKSEYTKYQLKDGDMVEVINAVGGG
ncbi:MAG: thiamine biosynthesis protein ThiS [Gammaproteobacteria bacterium]|jgi:thiamine biosynthesis protein ThiS|tara:strand:+ start:171 stop:371 length:201 start_codon:yes stop_codon:yes gene_type:complete